MPPVWMRGCLRLGAEQKQERVNLRICEASAAAVLSLLREEMPSAMPMVVGRAARARRPRTMMEDELGDYIYVYIHVCTRREER